MIGRIDGFKFSPMSDNQVEEVSEIVSEAFCKFDPTCVASNLSYLEVKTFVDELLRRSLKQKTTVVVENEESNVVAGALICEDLETEEFPLNIIDENKWGPILDIVDKLDNFYKESISETPAKRVLHMFMLAVRKDFSGHKLGENLIASALNNAQQLGYDSAIAEATGPISQHLFKKKNFRELYKVDYQAYKTPEGHKPFTSIDSIDACRLLEYSF